MTYNSSFSIEDAPLNPLHKRLTFLVGGGWLIVRDGVWVDWVDDAVDDLPCFDLAGRPVPHGLRWQDWVEVDVASPSDCEYCQAIRELDAL